MTSSSDLTYPPTPPKLWHKSYLIWFLEPHIEHKIWWRWMHIHILSLLKVIVILYSIRQTQINQNLHIGKWKYAKKRKWIYEIVTSLFDTHPPLIYVTISSSKEIMFWNRYPPTFWSDVIKYAVFFLMASLSASKLQNIRGKLLEEKFQFLST